MATTVKAFLETIYADADLGWLSFFSTPSKKVRWFRVGADPPETDPEENCYFGIGIRKKTAVGRGVLEDVIGIPGLWLDLDYESPEAHKASGLPPDENACHSLLARAPHAPTVLVHSGHGLQAYWLFKEPWYFESPEEHQIAQRLSMGWQSWFRREAEVLGWHVDSTADLTRVFRLPGTFNVKRAPVLVTILGDRGPRYEPDDFQDTIHPGSLSTTTAKSAKLQPKQIDVKTIQRLPDRIKYLILHGDTLHRYPSRSEAVYAVINGLFGVGSLDEEIAGILLDEKYAISGMPREKGARWVDREIARARQKSSQGPEPTGKTAPQSGHPLGSWREKLLVKKNGDPTMNYNNIALILANHPHWHDRFWWDAVRAMPMLDDVPLADEHITHVCVWLGLEERMAVSSETAARKCVIAQCLQNPRDLLQIWLNGLPIWDQVRRLDYWLSDVAGCPRDDYGMAVSRIIPLSMVARAFEPGCLYRYVVVLEGPENTGKSALVRAVATPEWHVELSMGLETKEAHMMLQGCWLAELPELDSLSRTEEARFKAFVTFRQDSWIPKYANFRINNPRRTVFIGTTNDASYLKGETGNTRFLPIKTDQIDVPAFEAMREQIFAEAFYEYIRSDGLWWMLTDEAMEAAKIQRDDRRTINVFEEDLAEWLAGRPSRGVSRITNGPTTWREIAEDFLKLDSPAQWKDKSLQMQVTAALKVLGWKRKLIREGDDVKRVWIFDEPST